MERMNDDDSDAELNDILATVQQWQEAFAESREFAGLTEAMQRESGAIIEFFAQYSHTHLGLAPKQWNAASVKECCTEILPQKVSAKSDFFEAVSPVLSAFFGHLGTQSILPNGSALAKAAAKADRAIVANAKDRGAWGFAKNLVMNALEADVDIEDPTAFEAFVARFNQQLTEHSRTFSSMPSPWSLAAPETQGQKIIPPENPYDPCPCGSGKKFKFCCKPKG